jgi:hypothetical protein
MERLEEIMKSFAEEVTAELRRKETLGEDEVQTVEFHFEYDKGGVRKLAECRVVVGHWNEYGHCPGLRTERFKAEDFLVEDSDVHYVGD